MDADVFFDFTTHVELIIANCNFTSASYNEDNLLSVTVNLTWTSYIAKNTLPHSMILALSHLSLFRWFRYRMNVHESYRIRVKNWIFCILLFAFADTFLI